MLKRCLPTCLTVSILLITLVLATFTVPGPAEVSKLPPGESPSQESEKPSVTVTDADMLRLIPKKALGVLYCPSLLELDNSINALVTKLSPQTAAPNLLMKLLTESVGPEFESLAGFEEIGVDVNRGGAVFTPNFFQLPHFDLAALVHLTDPTAMKQVIEAKGGIPTQYNGVTYWNATEGNASFAVLENILVVSTPPGVCEDVIDIHNGVGRSILQNPNYDRFFTDMSVDGDQVGMCIDIEGGFALLDGLPEEELEVMEKAIDEYFVGPFEDRGDPAVGLPIESIEYLRQFRSVSTRVEIEGTDVQTKFSMIFQHNNDLLKMLEERPGELGFLEELPHRASINAAFQGSSKSLSEFRKFWPMPNWFVLSLQTPEQQAQRDSPVKQWENFHAALADRWSVSVDFGETVFPNLLFIYELNDERRAKADMDEILLEELNTEDLHAGQSMMYNRVEINSYILPNFKERFAEEFPEPLSDLMPTELHWHYAFTDGLLLWTIGTGPETGPESIRMALDRKAGNAEKFSDHPGYQKLVDRLGTADTNVFVAISPAIAAKNLVSAFGKMDKRKVEANNVALLQMLAGLFMNLPENYSLGFSAKAEDNGIDLRLFIALNDFRQVIQMISALSQLGMQMQ